MLAMTTPRFIANEFLQDDVNKFAWLARGVQPVGGLDQGTHHHLEQSRRYREILAPLGLGDELRAALITHDVCWGFLCLHRDRSSPPFTPAEAAFLDRLAPHLATGLRNALLLSAAMAAPLVDDSPGLLLLAFEVARPLEIAQLIVQPYALTRRESEIVRLVAQGQSTTELAETFHITANTVQDHLKAIFEKVGVRSRRELVGQLFAQQYQPRMAAGHTLGTDGWFA